MKRIFLSAVAVLLLTACRSRKEATLINEANNYTYCDSVSSKTESMSLSEKNEAINIMITMEETGKRLEFQDTGGEIHFHPDGAVTMSGVAAYEIKNKISLKEIECETSRKDSTRLLSGNDSIYGLSRVSVINTESTGEKPLLKKVVLMIITALAVALSIKTLWRRSKN